MYENKEGIMLWDLKQQKRERCFLETNFSDLLLPLDYHGSLGLQALWQLLKLEYAVFVKDWRL